MLTAGDDFPLHQTPDPIAFAGTDRNFYDRYFFNGYPDAGADPSTSLNFFGVAFGVYPNLDVADAHLSVVIGTRQVSLHASMALAMQRLAMAVGPVAIAVEEPLWALRVTVAPTDGIAADLHWTGRHFPIAEPRFTRRIGARAFMDYTRMTQNGRWSGWIDVDGTRYDVGGWIGTRDRSWGIRPVGAPDPQPVLPVALPQFFWLWAPVNWADHSSFYHLNADAAGTPWNERGVTIADRGDEAVVPAAVAQLELTGTSRHVDWAMITVGNRRLTFAPVLTFPMTGLGYGHADWRHGGYKGALAIAREDGDTSLTPALDRLHIQALCDVRDDSGAVGRGVFEQLMLGDYAPLGLTGLNDV